MESTNITNARKNLFSLAEQAVASSKPVRITSKTGDVVLMSAVDWEAVEETLYLYSVPGLVEDILAGGNEAIDDCATPEDVGWPPIK